MTEFNFMEELKSHFINADFLDATSLVADICPVPDGVFIMHNSYAFMVGCKVLLGEDCIAAPLIYTMETMRGYIRNVLLALEDQKGLIVDGYLLIVLNREPNASVKEVVREVELDTKVCRKHIVWPSRNGTGLDRLQFVTILSLPEPLHVNFTSTTPFQLSCEASALLCEYKNLGNLDRLMSAIKSGELDDANRST